MQDWLQIAKSFGDPFAIAHVQFLLGMYAMQQQFGLEFLENAHDFMKTCHEYDDQRFYPVLNSEYVYVLGVLAESRGIHEKYEESLQVADERCIEHQFDYNSITI